MAASLQVIVSDGVGAGADLVQEGVNGFVFPRSDARSLTEALGKLLLDPEMRSQFGAASRIKIQTWDYASVVTDYKAMLQAVLV